MLKELRNDKVTKSIPIILLSARAGEEARVEGVEAGADDYLTKPFSTRELIARVTTNLKLAQIRKEAEEAILDREERLRQALIERERSEEKVRATLDSITDGFHVVDARGRFTYFNASARRIFSAQGLNPDALLDRDYFEMFPENLTREVGRTMKQSLIERVPTEAENFYAPWQRWFSVRHYPVAEGGVSTFFHDITERKQAEEALRASEYKFRLYFESNILGNIIGDLDGRIYEANDEYLRIIGYSREELVAKQIRWDTITPPEFLQLDHQSIDRARKTGFSGAYEKQYIRKDGSRIWVIVGFVIYEGTKTVAFILDISDRKRADDALREANAQLADKATHLDALVQQRTAKLRETVGELEAFSYSIAHDMRAPLRSLQGFSDILLNDYRDKLDADGQRFLKRIAGSAGRMDKLIQDVLNYSRVVRGELPLETVDLDKLLHGIVDTYPAFTPEKAEITLQGPLPSVLGNEAMLTQIFSNLIGNAVKFVPTGVKPQVRVWAERRALHVRLFVKDNGIGIESDQHEKIFSIFQQVNKDFEGTGIGLAIVKKAVERMGGKVGLESELDRGSTFWIDIPAG